MENETDEQGKSMLFRLGMTLLFFVMIYSLQRETTRSIVQEFNTKYNAYLIRTPDGVVIIFMNRYKPLLPVAPILLQDVPYTLKKESFTKIDRI